MPGSRRAYAEHLAGVPIFSSCSKRELEAIAKRSQEVSIPEGRKIVEQGQTGGDLYVILEGEATVVRSGRKIMTLGPGRYFGELAVLGDALRSATVRSDTPMRLLVLGRGDLADVVRSAPNVALKLLASMAHALREANAKAFAAS